MNFKKIYLDSMKNFSQNFSSTMFRDKDVYAEWLAQTYFFVRHSTPLLGFALPHLQNENLRHHFEHHLGEEERHDAMLIKDLEKMGRKISEFEEFIPTSAFYQSQYYRISFENGTSLLGYILFLEGLAVHWAKDSYMDIKDTHAGSVLFLKVHAEEDPEHLDQALNVIASLSPEEQKNILNNFRFTEEIYQQIINRILAKRQLKKAA